MKQQIRMLLARHGGLSAPVETLADDADLYAEGLSSFAAVQLMLALEDGFGFEYPDHLLNRRSFASIRAIEDTILAIAGHGRRRAA